MRHRLRLIRLAALLLLLLPLTASAAPAATPAASAAPAATALPGRLPAGVRPTHYDLELTPDAGALAFAGREDVDLEITAATSSILLNARELAITHVTLVRGSEAPLSATVTGDDESGTATLAFAQPVAPGKWRLHAEFAGKIAAQPSGMFAADWGPNEHRQRALFTSFEPGDARRLFPCWDQPDAKATFTVTVVAPTNQMVVGNMPVAERKAIDGGRVRVRLAMTPPISTYLVFVALGDFERLATPMGATEVGVVARRGTTPQAAFGLESAAAALHDQETYFGIPFPLPKLDTVATPGHSLIFGAMENWGAIQTFERGVLLDPALASESDRQRIFTDAAHEIAHQWFGDLVTLAWWDDVWLNEGFASWMEGRTTERVHPEWESALDAVPSRDRAMTGDALPTAHPIVQPIATVEEASAAFDGITYAKSEAVLRMLEEYVGPATWRTAVQDYLHRHAFGNTTSADLWRAVETASRQPVAAIAHDFATQPGVPLLRVEGASCVGGSTRVTLRQDELRPGAEKRAARRWHVPVLARTLDGTPTNGLVADGHATLTVPGCGPLLVNAGQSGYFRALYDRQGLAALTGGFARLAPIDQLGLLADREALGLAGLEPASDVLALATATPADAAPQVWDQVASTLTTIDGSYPGDTASRRRFRAFARGVLTPVVARLGWEPHAGESVPTSLLRGTVLTAASTLDDPAVVAEARRRFLAAESDPKAMPQELRQHILGIVALHADAPLWEMLHARARAATSPSVHDQLYGLLGAPADDALARRALELALTGEPGAGNSTVIVARVARLHPELAFDFALAHRAQLNGWIEPLARAAYFPRMAAGSSESATRERVLALGGAHASPEEKQAAARVAARIADRIRVQHERLPEIDTWVAQRERAASHLGAGAGPAAATTAD
jgi:aminopeptidase N